MSTSTTEEGQMTSMPARVTRSHAAHRLYLVLVLLVAVGIVLLVRHDWEGDSTPAHGLRGSGAAATQSRDLPSFTAVDLAGANNVAVHVGGKQAVVVRADDNLLDLVTTEVRDGALVIANTGSFTTRSPMRVDVTVPTLDTVVLSGVGTVRVEAVDADQFTARLPGSGVLHVSGTAGRLDATLGGSGDLRLQDLIARHATVAVTGSGRLLVHATGTLDASVSGSGTISYSGDPRSVTQTLTGTGAISKKQ